MSLLEWGYSEQIFIGIGLDLNGFGSYNSHRTHNHWKEIGLSYLQEFVIHVMSITLLCLCFKQN